MTTEKRQKVSDTVSDVSDIANEKKSEVISLPSDNTRHKIYVINRAQQHSERLTGKELRITEYKCELSEESRIGMMYIYRIVGKAHTWLDYMYNHDDGMIDVRISTPDIMIHVEIPPKHIGSGKQQVTAWFSDRLTIKQHPTDKALLQVSVKDDANRSVIIETQSTAYDPYPKKLDAYNIKSAAYDMWMTDIAYLWQLEVAHFHQPYRTVSPTVTKSHLTTAFMKIDLMNMHHMVTDDFITISSAALEVASNVTCSEIILEGYKSIRDQLYELSH